MVYQDRSAEIREMYERKQANITKSVALQAAVALIGALKPNKAINETVPDVIDIAKAFEKYLAEK